MSRIQNNKIKFEDNRIVVIAQSLITLERTVMTR